MYKGKNGQYVTAGVQGTPGMRLNVRGNVRLPDSEAGVSWYDAEAKPYYAQELPQQIRKPVTVPLNGALVFLCVLFVVFGALTLSRVVNRAAIVKNISAMETAMQKAWKDNADLTVQLAEARDLARIGYDASHRLQMIAASNAETIAVRAPETRPYSGGTVTAQTSPFSASAGRITGSR